MSESQLVEYKESWRDEYIKWICASFACQNSFSEPTEKPNTFFFQKTKIR